MLDLWQQRAEDVAVHGWFWEYTFLSLQVIGGSACEECRGHITSGGSVQLHYHVTCIEKHTGTPQPVFVVPCLFTVAQVESTALSPDRQRAIIDATVQEAARLVDVSSGSPSEASPPGTSAAGSHAADSYLSSYRARYELVQDGRAWKIVGGAVLR